MPFHLKEVDACVYRLECEVKGLYTHHTNTSFEFKCSRMCVCVCVCVCVCGAEQEEKERGRIAHVQTHVTTLHIPQRDDDIPGVYRYRSRNVVCAGILSHSQNVVAVQIQYTHTEMP